MNKYWLSKAVSVFLALLGLNTTPLFSKEIPWVVYYSENATLLDFEPYEWIVLDPSFDSLVHALQDKNKNVFAYLSLGSYHNGKEEKNIKEIQEISLGAPPNWVDSTMVDVRKPAWTKRILEEKIPEILLKGFRGLFLDTVDHAQHLETTDPKNFAGMQEAMLNLIIAIRQNYPEILIIMNRGFFLGDKAAPYIDAVLLEDLFTSYDFEKKKYILQSEKESTYLIDKAHAMQEINPNLVLLSLDFSDPKDIKKIERLYERSKKAGFSPYVTTIGIDTIIHVPKKE